MIMTTTPVLQGYEITEYLGIVSAEAVMGINIVRDVMASVRDVVGGRSKAYEEKLAAAKAFATEDIKEKAQKLGADAIIGVDFDFETHGQGMMICMAAGTAVRIEKQR